MLRSESHMGLAAARAGYGIRTAGKVWSDFTKLCELGRRAVRRVPCPGSHHHVLAGLLDHRADVGELVPVEPFRKRTHERFRSRYLQAHPLRLEETRVAAPPRNQGGQARPNT